MSFLCVLRQKEKLVKALNVFADRVILPPRSSSVKLETAEITLQVSWKLQKNWRSLGIFARKPWFRNQWFHFHKIVFVYNEDFKRASSS